MKTVTTLAEFDQVISSDHLVVVEFSAVWCGPSRAIDSIVLKWGKDYPDVIFVQVDIDANNETAKHCGINATPTFQFYKKGEKVDQVRGAEISKIKAVIEALK